MKNKDRACYLYTNSSDVFHMHDEFRVLNPLFKEVLVKMAAIHNKNTINKQHHKQIAIQNQLLKCMKHEISQYNHQIMDTDALFSRETRVLLIGAWVKVLER